MHKCMIVITKLSIIVMLRQWNRNNRKTFMLRFSITDSFVKAFVILFCYVFNDGNYNVNFELNPRSWIAVMVT